MQWILTFSSIYRIFIIQYGIPTSRRCTETEPSRHQNPFFWRKALTISTVVSIKEQAGIALSMHGKNPCPNVFIPPVSIIVLTVDIQVTFLQF